MNVDEIQNITIVGMGTMGPDISVAFSMAGYKVIGLDINQTFLDRASRKISSNCQEMVEWELLKEEEASAVHSRISLTLDWDTAVTNADYITEVVPEVMETKKHVLKQCEEICAEEVIIASNTSTMKITELSSEMKYPQRSIGTHWFIPAHLTPPVEVIPGEKTSEATSQLVFDLLKKVGKFPVFCKDLPGFIHNYVQTAMLNAALALVEQGISTPKDVDTVIEKGFALRLPTTGPFKFLDLAGLDTALNAHKYLYEKTGNPIFKPPKLLEERVRNGDLGVKTGKGFYNYSENEAENLKAKTNRTIINIKKTLKKIEGE